MNDTTATEPLRFCAICGRRIHTKESLEHHIGPRCFRRIREDAEKRQGLLFEDFAKEESKCPKRT